MHPAGQEPDERDALEQTWVAGSAANLGKNADDPSGISAQHRCKLCAFDPLKLNKACARYSKHPRPRATDWEGGSPPDGATPGVADGNSQGLRMAMRRRAQREWSSHWGLNLIHPKLEPQNTRKCNKDGSAPNNNNTNDNKIARHAALAARSWSRAVHPIKTSLESWQPSGAAKSMKFCHGNSRSRK